MSTMVVARPTEHALIAAPSVSSSHRQRRPHRRDVHVQQRGDERQQETSNATLSGTQSLANSLQIQSVPSPFISVSSDGCAVEAARVASLEIEDVPSSTKRNSKNRASWFSIGRRHRNQHSPRDEAANAMESQSFYEGGRMEADGVMKEPQHHFNASDVATNVPCLEQATETLPLDARTPSARSPSALSQARRFWMYQPPPLSDRENIEDEDIDSLRDFDASEWTPPDSSYGAAIPVAGWIPKSLRRSMEWGIIAAIAAVIVILIVRTSLRGNGGGSSTKLFHASNHNDVTYATEAPTVVTLDDYFDESYQADDAFDETTEYEDTDDVSGNDAGN